MVGVARGHQRANTLKLYSQKTSQSNHTRTTTQDGRVMVERSDRMWSIGEGNGKLLQYYFLEKPMNIYITICIIDDQCKFNAWIRVFKAGGLGEGFRIGGHMCIHGWFMPIYGKKASQYFKEIVLQLKLIKNIKNTINRLQIGQSSINLKIKFCPLFELLSFHFLRDSLTSGKIHLLSSYLQVLFWINGIFWTKNVQV